VPEFFFLAHCELSLSLGLLQFFHELLIIGLPSPDLPVLRLQVFLEVEEGLLELGNLGLVALDFLHVVCFDLGLLTFYLLVLPLELNDLEAEVIEFILHFFAVVQFLPQLGHSLVLLEGVDVGGGAAVGWTQVFSSVEFFHYIIWCSKKGTI
jgi:hypothetical protein